MLETGPSSAASDAAALERLGYDAHFDRSMSLWENFALGFTYLSPVVGVYSVFDVGIAAGGPPMFWSYFLAAIGQFLVCLTFCEVVSQFPISGGLYPWARRLVGRRWAWMSGWIYAWALFTTIAAVATGAGPFLATLLGFDATPTVTTLVALAIVVASTLTNLAGTKLLARVAMFGFICEILGAIVVGSYLLVFHRHQSLGVLFQTFGLSQNGSYLPSFLAAAIVGLFTCFGFEACGDVAEETPDPGRNIPKAMRWTIYIGMAAAAYVCLALILAQPDLGAVISGKVAAPVEAVLTTAFGHTGAQAVVVIVMVSFISCILSLQAASSRLVFAYARDRMIAGSSALEKLSEHTHVPVRALLLSAIVASLIICIGFFFQNALAAIVSFAVIGIYVAFQMIVLAAIWARTKGWVPAGPFKLGRAGLAINIAGLVYGIGAILDMLWPRAPDQPWYVNYSMIVMTAVVAGSGLLYMLIGRPYNRGTAPAGDAALLHLKA